MKEESIWVMDFPNQLIREKVMMPEVDDNDFYEPDWEEPGRTWFDSDARNRALKEYEEHLASRRTYSYPVSKEQDGKELREGIDFYFVDDEVPVDGDYKNGTGLAAIPINTDNENN